MTACVQTKRPYCLDQRRVEMTVRNAHHIRDLTVRDEDRPRLVHSALLALPNEL